MLRCPRNDLSANRLVREWACPRIVLYANWLSANWFVREKSSNRCDDVSSYRPISNLPVLSKLLELLVARQLMDYLSSSDLLPSLQSGFRPSQSTETAVLKVLSDILQAVDRGDLAALI